MKGHKKDKAKVIRDEILIKLSKGEDLRFSDLLIKNVDSNLFTYHLKSLKNENLIYKNGLKYNLTDEGKSYVESISGKTKDLRVQPKILSLVIVENKKGNYLFYKRNKHPFLGKFSFPYGKMHVGESVEEAARRELKEKTGVETGIKFKGNVYLRIKKNSKVLNHFIFNVFVGKMNEEVGFESLKAVEKDLVPGMVEILKLSKNKGNVFGDIEVETN